MNTNYQIDYKQYCRHTYCNDLFLYAIAGVYMTLLHLEHPKFI